MDTLEQLRIEWQRIEIKSQMLSDENRRLTARLASQRISGHQKKLANNYRTGYIGFAFPVLALFLYKVIGCTIVIAIAYALYGLVLGTIQLRFRKFIKKADYMSLPTIEAVSHARRVVKYQRNMTIRSIIGALAILVPLLYEFSFDSDILLGGIIGGIIGGIFGTIRCIDNFRHANAMLAEATAIDSDDISHN